MPSVSDLVRREATLKFNMTPELPDDDPKAYIITAKYNPYATDPVWQERFNRAKSDDERLECVVSVLTGWDMTETNPETHEPEPFPLTAANIKSWGPVAVSIITQKFAMAVNDPLGFVAQLGISGAFSLMAGLRQNQTTSPQTST